MKENEAIKLFKALSDKSRLQIVKNIWKEPMYVELLSERLGITPATVSFHLKKLMDAGIVTSEKEQYYVIYYINKSILNTNIIDIISDEWTEEESQLEREELYREKIISSFLKDGKLTSIPVQRKKRRIILEEICKSFEGNRDYSEKEVNIIIADYHDDFCTIRREMISEGLLNRTEGIYSLNEVN